MKLTFTAKPTGVARLLKAVRWKTKTIDVEEISVADDKMRLDDEDFENLIKLVGRQVVASKEVGIVDAKVAKKVAYWQTLLAKLTHTKANGISSKRAEINATMLKAYCGDKEIFQLDLTR